MRSRSTKLVCHVERSFFRFPYAFLFLPLPRISIEFHRQLPRPDTYCTRFEYTPIDSGDARVGRE